MVRQWFVVGAIVAGMVASAHAENAAALPAEEPVIEAPASPSLVTPRCKGVVPYLGSSLFATTRTERVNGTLSPPSVSLLGRIGGGAELRHCRGPTTTAHLRFGLTMTVAGRIYGGGDNPAIGLETEVSYPITPSVRLGARFGVDPLERSTLYTFGVRIRLPHHFFVGIDGLSGIDRESDSNRRRTSAMLGIGFDGRPGRYLSIIVLLFAGYAVLNSIDLR